MLVFKEFVFSVLYLALDIYFWIVFIYCIASFFVRSYQAWFVFLKELVEPQLAFIRRITKNKVVISGFDLSPIVLIFGLKLCARLLQMMAG